MAYNINNIQRNLPTMRFDYLLQKGMSRFLKIILFNMSRLKGYANYKEWHKLFMNKQKLCIITLNSISNMIFNPFLVFNACPIYGKSFLRTLVLLHSNSFYLWIPCFSLNLKIIPLLSQISFLIVAHTVNDILPFPGSYSQFVCI